MKRKRNWIITTAVAFVLASLLAEVAISQGAMGDHPGAKIWKQVLTPGQIKILMDFRAAHKAERKAALEKKLAVMKEKDALVKQLNITPAQEDQLVAIVSANVDQITPLAQPLLNNGIALKKAVVADNPSETAIRAAAAQVGEDTSNMAIFVAGLVAQGRSVLTADQVAAITKFAKERDADKAEAQKNISSHIDTFIALQKQLNITPDQINLAISLMKASAPVFEQKHKARHAAMEAQVKGILTADQFALLQAHFAPHKAMWEQKHKERMDEAINTWYQFNLTKPQMDQFLGLLEKNKSTIVADGLALDVAGNALRDEVVAANPDKDKIQAAAENFGSVLGDVAVRSAGLVAQAKQFLTADQLSIIAKVDAEGEQHAQKMVVKIPAHIKSRIELKNQLALTPEQRQAFKDLKAAREYQRELRIESAILRLGE